MSSLHLRGQLVANEKVPKAWSDLATGTSKRHAIEKREGSARQHSQLCPATASLRDPSVAWSRLPTTPPPLFSGVGGRSQCRYGGEKEKSTREGDQGEVAR